MKKTILKKYFNKSNLRLSWERYIRSNKLTKDYYGIKTFGYNLEQNIQNLSNNIIQEIYSPSRPQKIFIPKPTKTQRTITILDIEDALIYQAIANVIATKAYDDLSRNDNFVFGSVLCPEVKMGTRILRRKEANLFFFKQYLSLYKIFVDSVNRVIQEDKVSYKFETDITGFFDSISHYNLLDTLSKKFHIEDDILNLLSVCLNYWSGTIKNLTPGVGIPQGCTPSFFFANILLHDLDNMFISKAYSYYRYMDDIRIYGDDEQELIEVLVTIDKFLKGLALSINSKKTSIEKISEDERENLLINFNISLPEQYEKTENDNISQAFNKMAEQEGIINYDYKNSGFITLNKSEDIINFWKEELICCKKELMGFFNFVNTDNDFEFNKDIKKSEREILNIAYKFRCALKGLNNFSPFEPDLELLPYWLKILKIYFWRCDQICWVLYYYKNNLTLKKNAFYLIDYFKFYEWIKFHLFTALNVTQKFSKKELKNIFLKNKVEESMYTKLATYKLLIFHSKKDEQLFSSIMGEIRKEDNVFLKKQLLYDIERKKKNEFSFEDILKSLGI